MDLKSYPESKVWMLLEEMNIPWQKSLEELMRSYGTQKEKYSETVPLPIAKQIFGGVQFQAVAEIWDSRSQKYPAPRWLLKIVDHPNLADALLILAEQLEAKLGKGAAHKVSNVRGYDWNFGEAHVALSYKFEAYDLQGQECEPTLELTIAPDYRTIASEVEEELIEQSMPESSLQKQDLELLPLLMSAGDSYPEYTRRLLAPYPPGEIFLNFHKQQKIFIGVHGYLAFFVPASKLSHLSLTVVNERTETRYFIDGVHKAGGGKVHLACPTSSFSAKKIADALSVISNLNLQVEVQNNQY